MIPIPVVFHNGSVYDYHFMIRYLTREFEGNFECLGENTEKYISFTVSFKKVINDKETKHKIRFIDSFRFLLDSLSNLVDNLSELKKIKTGVKLELVTDEDMFLTYEKGIRGGMCQVTCKYTEANNKYMKDYDKNKGSSF